LSEIGCHGSTLKGVKKEVRIDKIYANKYFSFGEKIVKIGPVDFEIIWLKLKKE